MANHLYWRLNIAANAGSTDFLAIAELELRGSVGGADQCTGGTAIASASDSTAPVANAFDNDPVTRWSTPHQTLTGWIGYQFASPVDVAEYTIRAHPTNADRSPRDWALEWSDDGVTWTPVETREGQTWTAGQIKAFTVSTSETVAALVSHLAVEAVRLNLNPAARSSQVVAEVIRLKTDTTIRASQLVVEAVRLKTDTTIRASHLVVEVLRPNAAAIVTSTARPQVFICT